MNEPINNSRDNSAENIAGSDNIAAGFTVNDHIAPGTRLPSGAIVHSESPDVASKQVISRRNLVLGGSALFIAGYALGEIPNIHHNDRSQREADPGLLRIVYGGDVCEAPLYAAYENGFFRQAGLNVKLVKTGSGEDTQAAVGSGKYTAAPGIFFAWLKPIEQGLDVKLVAGLHEGCLRLVARRDGTVTRLQDLRGKKIGVSGLQSSALNFFSLDLLDVGIIPSPEAKQVEWVVIDNDLLPRALLDGQVDAIAASDPIALLATLDGKAYELANNSHGMNAEEFCCVTALHGKFVRDYPDAARRLVTAWAEGSRWVGNNLEATAKIEVDKKYVAGTVAEITPILSSYRFHPSAKSLRAALVPGIEKFAHTGFLDKDTDPESLADKVYADLGLQW